MDTPSNVALEPFADSISFGLPTLDASFNGIRPGRLTLIASRPSVGKTALALQLALNAARMRHEPIVYFSLESCKERLTLRLLSMISGLCLRGRKELAQSDFEGISSGAAALAHTSLYLQDTPAVTVSEIKQQVDRFHRGESVGLVLIDYLQLLGNSDPASNTLELRHFAHEQNLSVVVLSQLPRHIEAREDKRPVLKDIEYCGVASTLFDNVLLLSRKQPDECEVNVAKSLYGTSRNVLRFNEDTGSFRYEVRGD